MRASRAHAARRLGDAHGQLRLEVGSRVRPLHESGSRLKQRRWWVCTAQRNYWWALEGCRVVLIGLEGATP
jgi:hypothetical protein